MGRRKKIVKGKRSRKKRVGYIVTFNRYGRRNAGRAVLGGRGVGYIGEHNVFPTRKRAKEAIEEWFNPDAYPHDKWEPRIEKITY